MKYFIFFYLLLNTPSKNQDEKETSQNNLVKVRMALGLIRVLVKKIKQENYDSQQKKRQKNGN